MDSHLYSTIAQFACVSNPKSRFNLGFVVGQYDEREKTFRRGANDGSKRSTASLRSTAAPRGSVQNMLNGLNDLNDLNGSEATSSVRDLSPDPELNTTLWNWL
jgi:hypothetical protein